MSVSFNEHVLGVGPNGELPPVVFGQLDLPDANERAAMQAILDDYQAGQDATDTAVASVITGDGQAAAALRDRYVPQRSGQPGPELVDNGTFNTNLTGWTGTGWSWDNGTAKHTPGSTSALAQTPLTATVGTTYEIAFDVVGGNAGGVWFYFGGATRTTAVGGGTIRSYVTATATDPLLIIPTTDFNGAIDNVSIRALPTGDLPTFANPVNLHSGRIYVPAGEHIAIGYQALENTTRGTYNIPASNIAIGYRAGRANNEGHVTAVGYRAGEANTGTGVLTAFGKWAGMSNTTGHSTMFGNAAGMSNTTGHIDVFGDEAGADNTTGTIAVFGYYAGHSNVTGTLSAFGHNAADNCATDAVATVVGHGAGRYAGHGTTIVGHEAGILATGRSTAVGHEALRNTTVAAATAVGWRAGYYCTTMDSTFVGYQAGLAATTGEVVAIGASSALEVTTGSVVAIGKRAGYGINPNNAPKTDTYGLFIGQQAGRSVPSATAIIEYAAIGYNAQVGAHRTVALGANSVAGHNDSVAIGHSSTTTEGAQVMIGNRNLESSRVGGGIVLRSPDGTRYRISVANGGTLAVAAA